MLAPKKSLGQHWLSDRQALQTIINRAAIDKSETILEIGPGQGSLTELLAKQASRVVAVEYDEEQIEPLERRFSNQKEVRIVAGDILQYDLQQLPVDYAVVANIPYYITAPIIRRLLEAENPPYRMILLVQKEVAERLAAPAGKLSILGVSAQFYCSVTAYEVIPAALFSPPPRVDSQIIRLDRHQTLPDISREHFFRVVKAGFSNRRKTLKNALSGGLRLSSDELRSIVDDEFLSRRAQTLSIEEWTRLTNSLQRAGVLQ
jgi:16S rRNA (adenine1518-N6/adenine1519-N6)-dimethyltransferase